ncbi:hypothetical protein ACHAWC_005275 [Mediolabrus comicus]
MWASSKFIQRSKSQDKENDVRNRRCRWIPNSDDSQLTLPSLSQVATVDRSNNSSARAVGHQQDTSYASNAKKQFSSTVIYLLMTLVFSVGVFFSGWEVRSMSSTHEAISISPSAKSKLPQQKDEMEHTHNAGNNSFFVKPTDNTLLKYNEAISGIVIEKYKLVLFTNPKIGSTILKQLCRRMMGYEEDYHIHKWGKNGLPHRHPANGLNYTAHYPIEMVNKMMTSDEWTRATFVRDPKERVLSAYLMLRPQIDNIDKDTLEKARRGLFSSKKNDSLKAISKLGSPQIVNCCRKRRGVDVNWQILCLNHVLTFSGFLDAIDNAPRSKFNDVNNNTTPQQNQPRGIPLRMGDNFTARALRDSPGCTDIHWSPLTHWRLDPKYYTTLNFVGHLETAYRDTKLLLDRLHPDAWKKYGATGWGTFRNESIFSSSSTVNHAQHANQHLLEYFTGNRVERRVERYYSDDYDNVYLDLDRVSIRQSASLYYENRTLKYS